MSDPGENFPSQGLDPADVRDLGGAFRMIFRKLMQNTDGMLPASVVAVDAERNYVTVQPMIKIVGTGGTQLPRAQIVQVPLFNAGAGSYVLSFPVTPGDLGWIVASDRDISLYLQNNQQSPPNTRRMHSFEDGLFIPDMARLWTLAGGDAAKVVLQNKDGTIKITLGADQITLVHPTKVEVQTPLAHFTADVTIDGKLTSTGLTSLGGGSQFLKRADGSNATNVKGT
jgi:hypothetical protein